MKLRGEATNTNFKMYKSKKVWLFCSTLVCSGILMQGQIVSADASDTPATNTELATSASPATSQGSVQFTNTTDATSASTEAVTDTTTTSPSDTNRDTATEPTKEYIPAKDVDASDKNQSVQDFYQSWNGTNYSKTTDADGNTDYKPIEEGDPLHQEISEATEAEAVRTEYSSNTEAVAEAAKNEDKTVDGKMVQTVGHKDLLPDDIDKDTEVATLTERGYYSIDYINELEDAEIAEYQGHLFVIEDGIAIATITPGSGTDVYNFTPLTPEEQLDLDKAVDAEVVKTYRFGRDLILEDIDAFKEDIKQAYLDGKDGVDIGMLLTTTDPAEAAALEADDRIVVDLSTEPSTELVTPTPAANVTIHHVYIDGNNYYTIDGSGAFTLLNEDQLAEWLAADDMEVGVTAYATDKAAIETAVKAGFDRVVIDGEVYRINTTNNSSAVPEGAAVYENLEPDAMAVTDLKTGAPLTTLDTINPGIKVSLFDYWIDPTGKEGANKEGLAGINANSQIRYADLNELGINAGNTLKFSPGGANITNASDANRWQEGKLISGIYNEELVDGYPTLSADGTSVDYLFDSSVSDFKSVLADEALLNLFVSDGNGGYTFDSAAHNVYFDGDDVMVYNNPNVRKGDGKGQFFPLNNRDYFFDAAGNPVTYSSSVDEPVNNSSLNHYFGMKMSTSYIQPEDGRVLINGDRVPMVFNFSGDDDFLLYIDGKLALDLGGIHSVAKGSIDFESGIITRHVIEGATEISYGETTLSEVLGPNWDEANKEHTIDIFYMERGNDASNLKVGFNLQIPEYHYATMSSYGVKEIPGENLYVYLSDVGGYYTQDTEYYAYATSSNYGVKLIPETPPTPDPDPDPDPDPEDPKPTPTPETPDPVTPSPTTPDPDKPTPAPTTPGMVNKAPVAKPTATVKPVVVTMVASDDKKTHTTLPQTGDETTSSSIWGMVALTIAGFFGIAVRPKRKNSK